MTNTPGAINLSYSDGTSPSKTRTETSQTGTGGSVTVVAATGVLATEHLPKTFNANPSDTKDYYFKIKNTGNVDNNYTFSIDSTGKSGTVFTNFHFYQSSNLPVDPTAATYGGSALSPLQITTVTPGQEFWIKVSVQVQAGAADEAFNLFNLTSTSVTQTNVPQGGSYASTVSGYKITVMAPVLSIVISGGESDIISTPADQSGGVAYSGTKVIPGSVVRYTVSISNTGSGTANTVSSSNTGSDHLANMALVDNSVDLDDNNSRADGTAGFEVTGKGTGDTYSNRVTLNVGTGILTVTFPSIASGETRKYRYNVAVQ